MTGRNSHIDIIAGLKNNDNRAFDQLFDQHFRALCYFAGNLVGDKEEAKDIALNSFTKLWTRREYFDTILSVKAFLYITTRNACLDYLRSLQREDNRKKELAYLQPEAEETIKNQAIESEVLQKIYNEVKNLPRKCRQVFQMSYFEGLSTHEIATSMNLSESTVRNQRARALQLLRIRLSDTEWILLFTLLAGAGIEAI